LASKRHTLHLQQGTTTSQDVAVALPIFAKEFMQHNKGREEEIRLLLRANFHLEKQNLVLFTRVRTKARG
jgi:hypothetical protein